MSAASSRPLVRAWHPDWPCPVGVVLSTHRRGRGDPTFRVAADGAIWRGVRTPEGPATLRLVTEPAEQTVTGEAWGSGADWVLDSMPRMLGALDDPSDFTPLHEPIAHAWRRHGHWRLGATGLVMESLVPAIIEQKVTGQEAFGAFRALVHRFGERAPGPPSEPDPPVRLWLQPSPEQLRAIPWVFAWSQNRHLITGWYGFGTAIGSFRKIRGSDGDDLLARMFRKSPLFLLMVDEVEKSLFQADMEIATRYASLVEDAAIRSAILDDIKAEYRRSTQAVLWLTQTETLAGRFPNMRERFDRLRAPMADIHALQVDLLREVRGSTAPKLSVPLLQTMNCIATGLGWTG